MTRNMMFWTHLNVQVARIATYKETRADGFIGVDLDQGIGSKFDMTFKMRTKEKEGLMVYVADDTQVRVFVFVFLYGNKSRSNWNLQIQVFKSLFTKEFVMFAQPASKKSLTGSLS